MTDGYYLNSLRAWKAERQNDHRRLMSRYARMIHHPPAVIAGQGALIELNKKFLCLIDEALAEANLPPSSGGAK